MSSAHSVASSRRITHTRLRELLFVFDCGPDRYRCELHDPSTGVGDVVAHLFKNDAEIRSRQFETRADATLSAMVHRDTIVKSWRVR
jgi:hypothetical protein